MFFAWITWRLISGSYINIHASLAAITLFVKLSSPSIRPKTSRQISVVPSFRSPDKTFLLTHSCSTLLLKCPRQACGTKSFQ